jgi:hypothetical protein
LAGRNSGKFLWRSQAPSWCRFRAQWREDDEASEPHRARDQLIRGYLLPTSLVVKAGGQRFQNTEGYLLSYSQDSLFRPINVSYHQCAFLPPIVLSFRPLCFPSAHCAAQVLSGTSSPSLCLQERWLCSRYCLSTQSFYLSNTLQRLRSN